MQRTHTAHTRSTHTQLRTGTLSVLSTHPTTLLELGVPRGQESLRDVPANELQAVRRWVERLAVPVDGTHPMVGDGDKGAEGWWGEGKLKHDTGPQIGETPLKKRKRGCWHCHLDKPKSRRASRAESHTHAVACVAQASLHGSSQPESASCTC